MSFRSTKPKTPKAPKPKFPKFELNDAEEERVEENIEEKKEELIIDDIETKQLELLRTDGCRKRDNKAAIWLAIELSNNCCVFIRREKEGVFVVYPHGEGWCVKSNLIPLQEYVFTTKEEAVALVHVLIYQKTVKILQLSWDMTVSDLRKRVLRNVASLDFEVIS